jgi:seryl-tRNA(Sec) selenium transferase
VAKIKKNTNMICRVSTENTRQTLSLPSASYVALGKESALPSAGCRPLAKTDGRQL